MVFEWVTTPKLSKQEIRKKWCVDQYKSLIFHMPATFIITILILYEALIISMGMGYNPMPEVWFDNIMYFIGSEE